MEDSELAAILEALLFVSGDPLSFDRIHEVVGGERERLMFVLLEMKKGWEQADRGLSIIEVAGGYQMVTRPEVSPWVKALERVKITTRLTRPGLETLAVIAYRQPATRAEIESIRGVDAAGVLRTLMERKLVKIVGRKEVPGRPMMYGTTRQFLEYFGLSDLTALPTLKEMADLAPPEASEQLTLELSTVEPFEPQVTPAAASDLDPGVESAATMPETVAASAALESGTIYPSDAGISEVSDRLASPDEDESGDESATSIPLRRAVV